MCVIDQTRGISALDHDCSFSWHCKTIFADSLGARPSNLMRDRRELKKSALITRVLANQVDDWIAAQKFL
jgi:hypothetical protein